jgi:hypothetical protein
MSDKSLEGYVFCSDHILATAWDHTAKERCVICRLEKAEQRIKELEQERDEARKALLWALPDWLPLYVRMALERARAAAMEE